MARQQPRKPPGRITKRLVLEPGWIEADARRALQAYHDDHPWCWNCNAPADCSLTIATDYGTYIHYNSYVLCEACYDNPQVQARLMAAPVHGEDVI